jgi:hypothetical protein
VCEGWREVVDWEIVKVTQSQMSERGGKMVQWISKLSTQSKMSNGGRERIQTLVEAEAK